VLDVLPNHSTRSNIPDEQPANERGARDLRLEYGNACPTAAYGQRTSAVRALSVVPNLGARDTGEMGSTESFEDIVLPNLDAAYRLARWLMRNEHDAEDVVQEASLRALRYFDTFTGGNGRAWFLRIVRNTCWSWRGHGSELPGEPFDEEQHSAGRSSADPETLAIRSDDASVIERALRNVPGRFRELLVLRELEGLSYRELADVLNIPIGTVMSGLSRARQAARRALDEEFKLSGMRRRPSHREQELEDVPV
jgi:RNA polymerase sigma-70 factor (ECF subfamily)